MLADPPSLVWQSDEKQKKKTKKILLKKIQTKKPKEKTTQENKTKKKKKEKPKPKPKPKNFTNKKHTSFSLGLAALGLPSKVSDVLPGASKALLERTFTAHELICSGFHYFCEHPDHRLAGSFFQAALGLKYTTSLSQSFYRAAMCATTSSRAESTAAITSKLVTHLRGVLGVEMSKSKVQIPQYFFIFYFHSFDL